MADRAGQAPAPKLELEEEEKEGEEAVDPNKVDI